MKVKHALPPVGLEHVTFGQEPESSTIRPPVYLSGLFGPDGIHVNELCKIVNIIVASISFACSVKVGSEYDASPRRKRNTEIEIESIHVFGRCVKRALRPCACLHHIVYRP